MNKIVNILFESVGYLAGEDPLELLDIDPLAGFLVLVLLRGLLHRAVLLLHDLAFLVLLVHHDVELLLGEGSGERGSDRVVGVCEPLAVDLELRLLLVVLDYTFSDF